MIFKLFVVCLVPCVFAAPQEIAVTEAVVPAAPVAPVATVAPAAPVVHAVHPSVQLLNTCHTEFDEIESQTCTPRLENVCQTIEVVNQRLAYEKKCKDVVSVTCPEVFAPVGGTVLVKREADPALLYSPLAYPVHHFPYAAVKRTCQEITTEHCIDSPIVVDEPSTVETCHVVSKIDCLPTVEQIPKTICDPIETVAQPAPINPLAYHAGLLFGR